MTGHDKTSGGTQGKPSAGQRERLSQGARRESGKAAPPPGAEGRAAQRHSDGLATGSRPERYLVAAAPPAEAHALAGQLGQDPQISLVRMLGSALATDGYPPVAVIEATRSGRPTSLGCQACMSNPTNGWAGARQAITKLARLSLPWRRLRASCGGS